LVVDAAYGVVSAAQSDALLLVHNVAAQPVVDMAYVVHAAQQHDTAAPDTAAPDTAAPDTAAHDTAALQS
jgi:hypothetical protein